MLLPVYDEFGNLNKRILKKLSNKKLAVFLDYDGTLTPIVKHPALAILSPRMRAILQKISLIYTVAIISGRRLQDVKSKVQIKAIFYAGNHGLELKGPSIKKCFGIAYCREISRVAKHLKVLLKNVPHILIENKKFSLSVHFRMVDPHFFPLIVKTINAELKNYPALNKRRGKKVIEIYPNIGWDKGRAVKCFLSYFKHIDPNIFPIYLGDDVTDEDAFLAIKREGIGILVSKREKPSTARYQLKNTKEVYNFLNDLLRQYEHMECRIQKY